MVLLPGPRVAIDLVRVEYGDPEGGSDLYQLPMAFYPEPQEHLEHALIGVWADEDFGTSHVYDAVHDRQAMAHWLECFARGWGAGRGSPALPPAPRTRLRPRRALDAVLR